MGVVGCYHHLTAHSPRRTGGTLRAMGDVPRWGLTLCTPDALVSLSVPIGEAVPPRLVRGCAHSNIPVPGIQTGLGDRHTQQHLHSWDTSEAQGPHYGIFLHVRE